MEEDRAEAIERYEVEEAHSYGPTYPSPLAKGNDHYGPGRWLGHGRTIQIWWEGE